MEDVETVKAEALQIMGVFQVLPRLVVFDLDYTLWPFYCECRSKRDTPYLYPHARGILRALKREEIDVVIASKSPTPDIATTYLDKLSISSMFVAKVPVLNLRMEYFHTPQAFPPLRWTNKTDHFQRIHSRTGVPFNSMLFFDDDNNNIQGVIKRASIVSKMGVTSILVRNGVNLGEFKEGLAKFSQKWNASQNMQKRRN
ncbi:hypothetical protein VNO77_05204 [Canavalia gladiata]|uniref:Magnesium-dependent phosphatase 1 n=1 Tax=Canavalia gladiata TaxID=3824 RepID=A0AAN9MXY5_CANGL